MRYINNDADQEDLRDKMKTKQLAKFRSILDKGADPSYSKVNQKCIYEELLTTPDRADFLKLCVERVPNYVNPRNNKAAINYVVESLHFCNLLVLLYYDDKNISVDREYQKQTPLNYLAQKLTKTNAFEIRECMDLLLRKGASISIPDRDGKLPLDYVLSNEELLPTDKCELIYILSRDKITEAAWTYLKNYHDKSSLDQILSDRIKQNKKKNKINAMQYAKENYLMDLLNRYKNRHDENALKILFQTLYINSEKENKKILLAVKEAQNINLFKEIINSNKLNLNQFESIELAKEIIRKMPLKLSTKEQDLSDMECLKLLFKSKRLDVSGVDGEGIPLISFAEKNRNEMAVKELLNHGAYLGMRSNYRAKPIANVRPKILEEHLDSCITKDEEGGRQQNINIDLKNICNRPTSITKNVAHNDMATISQIKKSRDLQHLLTHPVIKCFLTHKWQLYSKFFYTHFAINLIFAVLISTDIISKFYKQNSGPTIITYLCWLFIFYLLICEVVQIFLGWLHYVKSIVNIMDISVIVLSSLSCFGSAKTQNSVATSTILFTFFKLFLLMTSLPIKFISMPFQMLFEVVKSVLKSSILLTIVGVFSVCFHIEFGTRTFEGSNNSTNGFTINYDSFLSSFVKSIIMSTGEYDASNIKFKSTYGYFLMIIFVIIVGISLFNFLTGQAVQDIQIIKNQAEIIRAIDRINFLNACEEFLNHPRLNRLKFLKKPTDKPNRYITIRLYRYPYQMTIHEDKNCLSSSTDTTIVEVEREEPIRSVQFSEPNGNESGDTEPCLPQGQTSSDPAEDHVQASSSWGPIRKEHFEKLTDAFKEFWSKLFSIKTTFIDTETVECAVKIVEKNSNTISEIDIENVSKFIATLKQCKLIETP